MTLLTSPVVIEAIRDTSIFYGKEFDKDVEFLAGDHLIITDTDDTYGPEAVEVTLLMSTPSGISNIKAVICESDWKMLERRILS